MADNRMFLVHTPTGRAVCLAKRDQGCWYTLSADTDARITALLEFVYGNTPATERDQFTLVMENERERTRGFSTEWEYTPPPLDGPQILKEK